MICKIADEIPPVAAGQPEKSCWTIGELAQAFQVTARALRHYEDEGLLHPRREGTTRVYSRRDHARLAQIRSGQELGFSLEIIRELIEGYERGGDTAGHRRLLALRCEQRIADLERQRSEIEHQLHLLRGYLEATGDPPNE